MRPRFRVLGNAACLRHDNATGNWRMECMRELAVVQSVQLRSRLIRAQYKTERSLRFRIANRTKRR